MATGYVHSIEIGSFVDGPGIRFVVFLSGCPLRCQYCHNPDAWKIAGEASDSDEVVAKIASSAEFLKSGAGGVTVSGGEPLVQAEFATAILEGGKALGLHTALDTSGYLGDRVTQRMLDSLDLVLLDIKSFDARAYRELTGVDLAPTLRLARRLSEVCKPVWIRFVLVPGLTDDYDSIAELAHFIAGLSNVERVEVLPFHQMARHKWEELGLEYRLKDTRVPTAEEVERAKAIFSAEGIDVDGGRFTPCTPPASVERETAAARG